MGMKQVLKTLFMVKANTNVALSDIAIETEDVRLVDPYFDLINGGRRGRPLACLSDITAWASGGRGGGRTLFPFPGAFIARRKLKQPNTL